MAEPHLHVSALITVEGWSDGGAGGFVIRALVRSGPFARDVVGPHFVGSLPEVRQKLLSVCELLATMVETGG